MKSALASMIAALGLSGQADESVSTDNVLKAVEIYEDVALAWLS
ncbi:hypothetical protein [Sinorhizobium medicae]|nr:hypothetical protein [Sinorhizobium medicae]WQO88846.1 hypothetical protein U8C37_21125 [Sinorhizobium medicae]